MICLQKYLPFVGSGVGLGSVVFLQLLRLELPKTLFVLLSPLVLVLEHLALIADLLLILPLSFLLEVLAVVRCLRLEVLLLLIWKEVLLVEHRRLLIVILSLTGVP